jgi:type VI secretion system protein ImpF
MARSSSQYSSSITLSPLDRLMDDDPDTNVEAGLTHSQSVRLLKESVRRDLEWLLNTRRVAVPPAEALKEVNRSVYIYGLPDFSSFRLKDQEKLVRLLTAAIKLFEPRLGNVRVFPPEAAEAGYRTLRMRIEGTLLMDPAPEHVSFDTVLELTSGEYEVKNAG